MKIKKITKRQYNGKVYDLQVKNKRSYNIEGLAVHNSVGGSLIAYLMGITKLDPIIFNLIFERFIAEERGDYPDIDLDFEDIKREDIRLHLIDQYGVDNVSSVSTFIKMKAKYCVRDVSRVFELPLKDVNDFCENIDDDIKEAFEKDNSFQEKYPEETEMMLKLEGTQRTCVSGDTFLILPNKNYIKVKKIKTLCKENYKGKLRMFDFDKGVYVFGDVDRIYEAGIKKVFKVTLSKNISIKTTNDHRFFTKEGWKELKDLKKGDFVATNGKRIPWNKGKKGLQTPWNKGLKGVQVAWNKGLTKEDHPSIKESSERMKENNPTKLKYVRDQISKSNYKHGKYCLPEKYKKENKICEVCGEKKTKEVHHIDINPFNNNSNNLLSTCIKCHKKIHWNLKKDKDIGKINPLRTIKWMGIKNIKYFSEEMTYDVCMKNKHQNFIGNKILLHNSGIHAAAIIVAPDNLKTGNFGNLVKRKGNLVINWDKDDAEYMGLMKLDVLGLNTLTILNETKKLIKENYNKDIIFENIPIDDKNVLSSINNVNTTGLFQLQGYLATQVTKQLKVDSFEDIVTILALGRPGPYKSGMSDEYIKRKHGGKGVKKGEVYEEVLKDTQGLICFQENVMFVANKVAGMTFSEADKLRKIIGKKRDKKEFEPFKRKFIGGCIKNKTLSREESEKVWDAILEHASYSFNRCLTGDTVVYRGSSNSKKGCGNEITIQEIWDIWNYKGSNSTKNKYKSGKLTLLKCDSDGIIRPGYLHNIHDNGIQTVYEIITKNGKKIKATKNHRFLTPNGYKTVDNLNINDKVIVNSGKYSEIDIVISIKKLNKKEQTFDLEMKDAPHNFIANGFVSHNSHSVAYAKITYYTAYLRHYYPTEFFCANLTYGKEDKKKAIMEEVYKNGLELVLPKIGISHVNKWVSKDNNLFTPFTEIKGVGEKKAIQLSNLKKKGLKYNNSFFKPKKKINAIKEKKSSLEKIADDIGAWEIDSILTPLAQSYFSFKISNLPSVIYPNLCEIIGDQFPIDVDDILIGKVGYPYLLEEKTFEINNNLNNCNNCELGNECEGPVLPTIGELNIAIICENPGFYGDLKGELLIDKNSNVLWSKLKKGKYKKKEFHISTVLKCYSKSLKKPEYVSKCSKWLDEELKQINAKIILAFGNNSVQYFTGENGGILKLNATTTWNEKYGCWVCWCISPSSIHIDDVNQRRFNHGISNFIKTLKLFDV